MATTTGQVTITDVTDGLSAGLTNNSWVFSTDSGGNGAVFTDSYTNMKVSLGGADDTANWTYYVSAVSNVSYRDDNDGADRTGTGSTNGLLNGTPGYVRVVALTADYGYLDITATRIGFADMTRRFSVAKSKAGVTPSNATRTAVLDMYQWYGDTAPTSYPSGNSTYTWATGQFTNPATLNNWTAVPGTPTAGQKLYLIRQIYTDTGTSAQSTVAWTAGSSNVSVWGAAGTNGGNGANGQRVGIAEVYRWKQAQPTTGEFPTGTSTYTWATGTFGAPSVPNGWSLTPGAPTAGWTLWACSEVISNSNTTPTDTITWDTTTAYAVGYAGPVGAGGVGGIMGVMSNEAHTFTAANDGTVSVYTGSGTTIKVYEGATLLDYGGSGSGYWTCTPTPVNIATGTTSSTGTTPNRYLTVGDHGSFTAAQSSAYIDYSISGVNSAGTSFSFVLRQSFSKSKTGGAGADGTISYLTTSSAALTKSASNVFTPATLVCTGYTKTGGNNPAVYANCRFKIYENGSGTPSYSGVDLPSGTYTYTPSSAATSIKVELYNSGGTIKMDEQTIPVAMDGSAGSSASFAWISSTAPVIFKDAPDAGTSGAHTNITVTGKLTTAGSTVDYGYLTVTANGDVEAGTATATSITTSIANSAGKTSYTVKLYDAANKTGLRDTQVVPVVFKGATGSTGTAAKTMRLSASSQTFKFAAGTVLPPFDFEGANGLAGWMLNGITFDNVLLSTTQKFRGAQSVKITNASGGNDTFIYFRSTTPPRPNTVYVLTAWVYVESITAGAIANRGLLIYDGGTSNTLADLAVGHTTGSWVKKSVAFTTGASPAFLEIRLYAPQGVVYWDAVEVQEATPANQVITLTASRQNISTATSWTTVPAGVALGGSGDTRTLDIGSQPQADQVTVTATSEGLSDSVTISKLIDGAYGGDALVGFLTNDSHLVSADVNGTVSSWSGCGGNFKVYKGVSDVTSQCTFSTQTTSNLTASIDASGAYSASGIGANTGTATFRATHTPTGVSVDRIFTVSKAITGATGATGDGANLIDPTEWVVGTTGAQGTFNHNGTSTSESAIVLGGAGTEPLGPFGSSEPLWKAISDGGNDPGGGFVRNWVPIDANKTYRLSVWFRYEAGTGNVYLGPGSKWDNSVDPAQTANLQGTVDDNPYFLANPKSSLASSGVVAGTWYLAVGILHGYGYGTTNSGLSGIYDRTGKKVFQLYDFKKSVTGQRYETIRAFQYYETTNGSKTYFCRPRFEELNGNEPTIEQLCGGTAKAAVQGALSNDAHTLSANADGTVTSYAGSGTEIRVYEGSSLLDYDGSGTTPGTWSYSTNAVNITRGSLGVGGSSPNRYLIAYDHTNMTADSAYIDYTISGVSSSNVSFSFVLRQSFAKSKTGSSSLSVTLTNDSHTCAAASDGTVSVFTNSGTDVYVYDGTDVLDYDGVGTSTGTWKFTSVTGDQVTPDSTIAISGTQPNRYATLDPITAFVQGSDNGKITFVIEGKKNDGTAFSGLTKIQTFSKSKTGTAGTNAKLVYLYTDRQTINYNSAGTVVASQTTTFTIDRKNLSTSNATVSMTDLTGTARNVNTFCSFGSGSASGNDRINFTGTTFTMTEATTTGFDTARNGTNGVVITVTCDGVSDKISIIKVQDGQTGGTGPSAITVILSRPAVSVTAASDGAVTDFSNTGTEIHVYEGSTELAFESATYGTTSGSSAWRITSTPSVSNVTLGTVTDSGAFCTVGNITAFTTAQNIGKITFTINGKRADGTAFSGVVVDQNFSKAKAGTNGANGLTSSLTLANFSVQCDSNGTPVSGAMTNATGSFKVYSGTTDVTSSCSFTYTTSSCTGSVSDTAGTKGQYSVTVLNGETGYLEMTATYNTVAIVQRFTLQKVWAGASSSTATDDTFANVTSGTYAVVGGPVSIPVGPNGTMSVSLTHSFHTNPSTTAGNHHLTGKFQWRVSGGSWADVDTATSWNASSVTTSQTPAYYLSGDLSWESGMLEITAKTKTGPASAAVYEFQYLAYRSSGTATCYPDAASGTRFNARWSP